MEFELFVRVDVTLGDQDSGAVEPNLDDAAAFPVNDILP